MRFGSYTVAALLFATSSFAAPAAHLPYPVSDCPDKKNCPARREAQNKLAICHRCEVAVDTVKRAAIGAADSFSSLLNLRRNTDIVSKPPCRGSPARPCEPLPKKRSPKSKTPTSTTTATGSGITLAPGSGGMDLCLTFGKNCPKTTSTVKRSVPEPTLVGRQVTPGGFTKCTRKICPEKREPLPEAKPNLYSPKCSKDGKICSLNPGLDKREPIAEPAPVVDGPKCSKNGHFCSDPVDKRAPLPVPEPNLDDPKWCKEGHVCSEKREPVPEAKSIGGPGPKCARKGALCSEKREPVPEAKPILELDGPGPKCAKKGGMCTE